ncbi:MAG: Ig-like domain-containing protein [Acidobacteria bacterium]|nr:Ig-like domain-containing protein [Acidobacteriota bacterium]
MRPKTVAPFHVERVDPPDGATGVLRDDPVLVRLSAPVDPDRLSEATVEVREADGAVPSRVETLDGGRVLVWWPGRGLRPGREHHVVARGLRDRRGREAPALASRFTPGPLSGREIRSPVTEDPP